MKRQLCRFKIEDLNIKTKKLFTHQVNKQLSFLLNIGF